jgi:N-acetylmuramate 1-kinase
LARTNNNPSDPRKQQLENWLTKQLKLEHIELSPVSGDASFRRYFRLNFANTSPSQPPNKCQKQSLIAVDAPPEHEDNFAFYAVATLLKKNQLNVPEIIKHCFKQGFLLISDLGNQLLLPQLNHTHVDELYGLAMQELLKMQLIKPSQLEHLPAYSKTLLHQEMDLFTDWFITQHLKLELTHEEKTLIAQTFNQLSDSAHSQPQCFVHRDYHSRNLMLIDNQSSPSNHQLGIIDFQDAVIGAITYDLVSLLKDCYIQWPEQKVKKWCKNYYDQLVKQRIYPHSFTQFYQDFEWMGMQRHIKVLGIFCRLNYRDHKPQYLADLKLTFDYLTQAVAKYPALKAFELFLQQRVMPAFTALH